MTRKWGCKPWGSHWGQIVKNLRASALSSQPAQALIEWDVNDTDTEPVFLVYVNGEFYGSTRGQEMVVAPGYDGRFYFEVFAVGEGNEQYDASSCLEAVRGDRIKLSFTRLLKWGGLRWGSAEWGLSTDDVETFDIYWDEGAGTSPFVLLESVLARDIETDTAGSYEYLTDPLAGGTYKFRVDPKDGAGNRLESALIVTVSHDPAPEPPSDFEITGYDHGAGELTASWTASPSSDVTEYRIYDDDGTGIVDYNTVRATISAPATSATWSRTLSDGQYIAAIRAADSTGEENNVHVRDDFEIDGSALLGKKPATPINLIAEPIAGGKLRIQAEYHAFLERSKATTLNFYYGTGGVVDYSTVIGTATIPAHTLQSNDVYLREIETGALTHGVEYTVGCRAADSSGRESDKATEFAATPDELPPVDHESLSGATSI